MSEKHIAEEVKMKIEFKGLEELKAKAARVNELAAEMNALLEEINSATIECELINI